MKKAHSLNPIVHIIGIGVFLFCLSLVFLSAAQAATYYVATTGLNTNAGTQAAPWLTIQKAANTMIAGDTCLVSAGTYNEQVVTTHHGTASGHIIFSAQGIVKMKGFAIKHRYTRVEGFDISKNAGVNISVSGNLSDHTDGSYAEIVNNTIHDSVFIAADDLVFTDHGATGDTVTSQNGNFLEVGFEPGMSVYITCPDRTPEYDIPPILNRNQRFGIKTVTNHTITFADNASIITEGPVYAVLTPWIGIGIDISNSGAYSPTNCLIQGNRLYNLTFTAINLWGSNHIAENNDISHMNSHDAFAVFGHDQIIRNNYFHDSPFLNGVGDHPDFFQSWGALDNVSGGLYNILVERNFVYNVDAAPCQWTQLPPQGGYSLDNQLGQDFIASRRFGATFKENVFVNMPLGGSIDFPNVQFINNTFYHAPTYGANALGFSTVVAGYGDGSGATIKNNAFVDAGTFQGFYGFGWDITTPYTCTAAYTDYNFVAKASPTFLPSQLYNPEFWHELHGINGGDPKFSDIATPLSVGGVPFTINDGLKPLPSSPLCAKGENGSDMGAYSCDPTKVFATEGNPLVLHLDFNNDWPSYRVVNDVSGSGNDASCQTSFYPDNDATRTIMPFNQCPSKTADGPLSYSAAAFEGSVCRLDSQYLAIAKKPSLDHLSQGTIALWIYYNPDKNDPNADPNYLIPYTVFIQQRVLDTHDANLEGSWYLGKDGSGFTYFVVEDKNHVLIAPRTEDRGTDDHVRVLKFPDATGDYGNKPYTVGAWHHYTVTWDQTGFKGYFDGALQPTFDTGGVSALNLGQYLVVGAMQHGDPQNRVASTCVSQYADSVACYQYPSDQTYVMPNAGFLEGKIADLRIYNRALEATDIQKLANSTVYGDVSGDGQVTGYDAALTAQAAVGLIPIPFTPPQVRVGDVDGNGEITANDAALIAQKAVGLIPKFPVEG